MRSMKLKRATAAILALSLSGCAAYERNPRTVQGAGIGAATGAGAGAAIGAILGGGKGAGKGAAIGAVVGLLGGTAIGHYMDKQAEEMQAVLGEQDRLRRQQESINVAMASDLLFATGSAQLFPGGREKLRQFAGVLARYPRSTVEVVGHTDSRGSEATNMDLSKRRAQSVVDELVAGGVSAARITSRGMGASQPVADNSTAEGRGQNRRVEINVTGDESLGNDAPPAGAAPAGGYEEPR